MAALTMTTPMMSHWRCSKVQCLPSLVRTHALCRVGTTSPILNACCLGRAAIVEHEMLPDRRHVLTRNSDEVVQRWNILNGKVEETYEGQSLQDVVSVYAYSRSDNS